MCPLVFQKCQYLAGKVTASARVMLGQGLNSQSPTECFSQSTWGSGLQAEPEPFISPLAHPVWVTLL